MKPISLLITICFFAVIIFDTLVNKLGTSTNQYLTKGFLMPLLIASFIIDIADDASKFASIRVILAALILCFIADLVWVEFKPRINFAIGAGIYTLACLCYAYFFYKQRPFRKKSAAMLFVLTILLIAAGTLLIYFMWNRLKLQNMIAVVIIYTIALELMLLCGINVTTSRRLKKTAVIFFVPGVLCFFISQVIILMNRFYSENSTLSLFYLLLYGAGQFMIVRGASLIVTSKKLS